MGKTRGWGEGGGEGGARREQEEGKQGDVNEDDD